MRSEAHDKQPCDCESNGHGDLAPLADLRAGAALVERCVTRLALRFNLCKRARSEGSKEGIIIIVQYVHRSESQHRCIIIKRNLCE